MLMRDYQTWANFRGASLVVDGQGGPATRGATMDLFVNKNAPAVTDDDIAALAQELRVSFNQISAVAEVESGGAGFDANGRPKILYERHKFDEFTGGKWSVSAYSNPKSGHDGNSWDLLCQALCKDIDAAYRSVSWGKFQVMGFNYALCGMTSPLELAYYCTVSEAHHYDLFSGYIIGAALTDELRQVSTDPDDCRPFAKGYNGKNYEQYGYHEKIAAAMQRLESA